MSRQKKYLRVEDIFLRLRILILFLGVFILVLNAIFFAVLIGKKKQLDLFNTEKKNALLFLSLNKEAEAKFIFFRSKEKQIATFLKQDVNFFPFYNLLLESLKNSSPAARLESVVIGKDRTTEFGVGFDDFNSLSSFLRYAESDDFLKSFDQLTLGGFNILKQQKKTYQISFKGKFKALQ